MVKGFIFTACMSFFGTAFSQDLIGAGLIKTTGSITPGRMVGQPMRNVYFSGFAEVYTHKKVSFRGDALWYVDGQSKAAQESWRYARNLSVYFGAFYHFNKNNWDMHLGFQPGMAVVVPSGSVQVNPLAKACPSAAFHVGSTFFVWKYFNFYADVAYTHTYYRGLNTGSVYLGEVLFTAGLGFNINVLQTKLFQD
ncbi:MAG: hypothetical protein RL632_1589 [Bacteroidota bacterium]|jgi:hypothetical protein